MRFPYFKEKIRYSARQERLQNKSECLWLQVYFQRNYLWSVLACHMSKEREMITKSIISSVVSQMHQRPWDSALVFKQHSSLPPLNPGFLRTRIIQSHLLLYIFGFVYEVCLKILFKNSLADIVSHFLNFLTYFLLVPHFAEIIDFCLCKKPPHFLVSHFVHYSTQKCG